MGNTTNFKDQSFITDHPFLSVAGVGVATVTIGGTIIALGGLTSVAVIMPGSVFVGFTLGVAEKIYRQTSLTPRAATIIESVLNTNIAKFETELSFHHSNFGCLNGDDNKIRASYNYKITKIYTDYFKGNFSEIHNNNQTIGEDLAHLTSEVREGLKDLHQKHTSSISKVWIMGRQYLTSGMKNPTYEYLRVKKNKTPEDIAYSSFKTDGGKLLEDNGFGKTLDTWKCVKKHNIDDIYPEHIEQILKGTFQLESSRNSTVYKCIESPNDKSTHKFSIYDTAYSVYDYTFEQHPYITYSTLAVATLATGGGLIYAFPAAAATIAATTSKTITATWGMPNFIWKNIPSFEELFIFSSLQSGIECLFNLDKYFGDNPLEKAFIRDFGKVPGEFGLSKAKSSYGSTEYWHDEFSLISTIQKPFVKAATVTSYYFAFSSDSKENINHLKELLKNTNNTIPNSVPQLVDEYFNSDILGKGARLSNTIGEPLARLIDGCSKTYQDSVINANKEQLADGILPQASRETNARGVFRVPDYVATHGISKLPYALTYASLKSSGLDIVGKQYKKLGLNKLFDSKRDSLDKFLLSYLDESLENLQGDYLHDKIANVWNEEDLGAFTKMASIPYLFVSQFAEKTAYNMITMAALSTPNKMLGNLLHLANSKLPTWIFSSVGLSIGSLYIKSEFFGDSKTEKFHEFVTKKKGEELTQEENCYAHFIDEVLSDNDSSDSNHNYDSQLITLNECLVSLLVESVPPILVESVPL